ncbi:MAG: ankyrin repeat domain-containing protein [Thermoanaerobaculia bacterium]|nr:ankyrin repeat domain-containing protein [Thermoanaerobaculia bacterium]
MKRPFLPLCLLAALVLSGCSSTSPDQPVAKGAAAAPAERPPQAPAGATGKALKEAVDRGDVELARKLIAAGADVNTKGAYDQTLVLDAASRKDPALLRVLVDAGADVNTPNTYGVTPLSAAAEQGNLEHVKTLLKGKAKVNARDTAGSTALTVAVLRGYVDVVKTLIAAGADVKQDKTELLEIANREKHADVAKIIEEAARK